MYVLTGKAFSFPFFKLRMKVFGVCLLDEE